MDFTLKIYQCLLGALKEADYSFQTFAEFIESPGQRSVILRHDVDAIKKNALRFANIQAGHNIRGTYYFRVVSQSFDEDVIREIASLGHEIGYHYETMDTCKGDIDKAYNEFCQNLEMFRQIVPVKTICMHGSPLSPYDNRDIWNKFDYKALGIIGEPYFDIDFHQVLYLTDTGRRWDGEKVSIRDKVGKKRQRGNGNVIQDEDIRQADFGNQVRSLRGTHDIISTLTTGTLADQILFTFHPQRWTNNPIPWLKELVWQNAKNIIKRHLIK